MNYKVLAIGAALGFAMALAPSCGPDKPVCDTSNCDGCCNADGTCTAAASVSATACGASGNSCVACGANETCENGACKAPTGGTDAQVDAGLCGGLTTGCCTASGVKLPGTSTSNCGENGGVCNTCDTANGEVCIKSGNNGGHCEFVDAGNGEGELGAACTTAAECTNLPLENSNNAICKTESTVGNLIYKDGFCTRRCFSDDQCGPGGACLVGFGGYGETENICTLDCADDTSVCREGYVCATFGQTGPSLCIPLLADGGFPERLDAGTPAAADVMGGPCTEDSNCQPPDTGACFTESLPDGGLSGYTGGSCTADCSIGFDDICGTTGTCTGYLFSDPSIPQSEFEETALVGWLCEDACTKPGTAEGCRPEYTCDSLGIPDAGHCIPRCDQPGNGCPTGQTCNASNGQCEMP